MRIFVENAFLHVCHSNVITIIEFGYSLIQARQLVRLEMFTIDIVFLTPINPKSKRYKKASRLS